MTIAIVDYGMGNLRSVTKGFERVDVEVTVASDPQVVRDAAGVVLPGVGAFKRCMDNLTERGLAEPVIDSIQAGTPFLGICLGLQLLFRAVTGQENNVAIVVSTMFIAALFQPLRRRGGVQATVDRRLYRSKYDAARTLAAFGARMRDEVDLGTLTGELTAVVDKTMQPAHVSLWLRPAPRRERT